jgi:hypothetical protein
MRLKKEEMRLKKELDDFEPNFDPKLDIFKTNNFSFENNIKDGKIYIGEVIKKYIQ